MQSYGLTDSVLTTFKINVKRRQIGIHNASLEFIADLRVRDDIQAYRIAPFLPPILLCPPIFSWRSSSEHHQTVHHFRKTCASWAW